MTRVAMFAAVAFLAGGAALTGVACESRHVDVNYGTEAGADFDAPARDAGAHGVADDGGADDAAD